MAISISGLQRKRKVFVSSTREGMEALRRDIIDGILSAQQIPVAMEHFVRGAAGQVVSDHVEGQIRACDIFIIMVADSLGTSHVDNEAIPYVKKELEIARSAGLQIIPVILEKLGLNESLESLRKSGFDDKARLIEELWHEAQRNKDGKTLGAITFRKDERRQRDSLCDSICLAVTRACSLLQDRGGGWVEANVVETLLGAAPRGDSYNPFFHDLVERLGQYGKLTSRISRRANLKNRVAEHFWSQYLLAVLTKTDTIFFESGSSTAYVSREFVKTLDNNRLVEPVVEFAKRARILTNNLVAFQELTLGESAWGWKQVEIFPPGPFKEPYGVSYGPIAQKIMEPPSPKDGAARPDYRFISKKVQEDALSELCKQFSEAIGATGLVLMAASGVDIRPIMRADEDYQSPQRHSAPPHEVRLETKNGETSNRPERTPFPGPHTGSFYNMLVKRALLKQSCPKVLFLDEYKWDLDFIPGACFAVCDGDFPWSEVVGGTPLAIAVGASSRTRLDEIERELVRLRFSDVYRTHPADGEETPAYSLIAANQLFTEQMGR